MYIRKTLLFKMLPLSFLYVCKGALTSKPYSFVARPWEFKSIESVDFFDSTVSSIRLDLRGDKILRILPRINDNVNEEWISDRIRFSVDGFRSQRIDRPLIKVNRGIYNLSWSKFMNIILRFFLLPQQFSTFNLKNLRTMSNVYNFCSVYSFPLQIGRIGVFNDFESSAWVNFFQNTFFLRTLPFGSRFQSSNIRNSFCIPVLFKDFFKIKNLLLVSINPRFESPILNIRLRQSVIKFGNLISSFGQNFYSSFTLLLNSGIVSLVNFMRGNHWLASTVLMKNSLVLIGVKFNDSLNLFSMLNFIDELRLGIFSRYSSLINSKEVGIVVPQELSNRINQQLPLFELSLNGALLTPSRNHNFSTISLTTTSHGTQDLVNSDFILPVSAPFERNSTFINLEGRVQLSRFVLNSPNNVLDLKDSIVMLITLFSNNNSIAVVSLLPKIILFLVYGLYSRSLWDVRFLWIIIYKLLNSFNVSKSFFIKDFFSNIVEYLDNSSLLDLSFTAATVPPFSDKKEYVLIENRNSGSFFETVENFYTQDEISLSSFSMLAANDRLVARQTYL